MFSFLDFYRLSEGQLVFIVQPHNGGHGAGVRHDFYATRLWVMLDEPRRFVGLEKFFRRYLPRPDIKSIGSSFE
jgi:hypothetical protein